MMITVQLLGGACLRAGDVPLAGPPAQRHRIALLTMVVAAWPAPLSRDRAMALLWPERDVGSSRRLLNLAVHVLRAALGENSIASTGDGLLWNPSHLTCDLHELRTAIAAKQWERIVELHAGPLLDGFHLDDSTDFGYWLDERRNDLAHAHVTALRALAERQERAGDVHGRVGTCRQLVAADPYSGANVQALMRALDAAGDRSAALQHAAEHARRLGTDLELPPDADVAALADRLRASAVRQVASLTAASSPHTASIAVLPFINLGTVPADECFADGITEDVTAQLSKIRALKVISRTSVLPFKQRQHALTEIGTALGATALLDGSVRHAGARVRIVARLVDVATDRNLWAETYDRQLTDIFAIQSDVALQIAAALKAELSREEHARVRSGPTSDVQAYQLFLQGRQSLSNYTPDTLQRAIGYFERAIARDPGFALALASMAMAYVELGEHGTLPPDVAFGKAAHAAADALRLGPDLSEAHCTSGYLKMTREFDWDGAEHEFRRALELSPSNADACDLYGRLCAAVERYDEAIVLLERAQELDPVAHRSDLATTLLRNGRYEEALRQATVAVEIDPSHCRARATLGWAYFLSGKRVEGLAELARTVADSSGTTLWLSQFGEACGLAGDTDKAREVLHALEEKARDSYVSPYHFAYVHTGLGEADRALDWLERAADERTGPVYGVKGSFLFAPLRRHPRFIALLRRMKLA